MDFPYALEVFSRFCLWNCVVAFLQEGGPGHWANFPWNIPKTPNLNWVDWFPLRFGGFLLVFAYELRCCIFAGGRPRVLSKFPLKVPQNPQIWIGQMDFPNVLTVFFWILLMELRCCIFAGGRPMALSKIPLKTPQSSKSELGRCIFPYVLEFFLILLMKLRCCIFAGGRPKALNEFQLKTLKTPNLNWADGIPLCFGGFF